MNMNVRKLTAKQEAKRLAMLDDLKSGKEAFCVNTISGGLSKPTKITAKIGKVKLELVNALADMACVNCLFHDENQCVLANNKYATFCGRHEWANNGQEKAWRFTATSKPKTVKQINPNRKLAMNALSKLYFNTKVDVNNILKLIRLGYPNADEAVVTPILLNIEKAYKTAELANSTKLKLVGQLKTFCAESNKVSVADKKEVTAAPLDTDTNFAID
jgi:hypothetical protein